MRGPSALVLAHYAERPQLVNWPASSKRQGYSGNLQPCLWVHSQGEAMKTECLELAGSHGSQTGHGAAHVRSLGL